MPKFVITQTMAEYKEAQAKKELEARERVQTMLWLFVPAMAAIVYLFYQAVNL